ncbi:MAG: hypothetical protein J6B39_03950, partial [Lachnospiraceae bacterium]|nr:hypothetical protein [Lachnospiraceae bacterium]
SAVLQLYIAESLAALGKREEAFEYVSKAVRNTDGSLPYDRLLMAYQMRMYEAVGTKKADEATMLETYRESVEFDARWPDFDIAMGYFYYMRDCYAETVEYLERAVAKAGMMNDFVYSRFPEHWKRICGILTVCCSNLKDWVGIVKYGTLYLQEDKNAEGVIVPILNQLVNVEQEPVEAVIGCLRGIYNLEDRKDLFFLIKCVNKAGLLSLEDALKKYLTDEERALIYKE